VVQTSFYVQQRDARCRWRTVTAAATRPMANGLGQELRRALVANPYSPVAAVRVVSDIELTHEMRIGHAKGAHRLEKATTLTSTQDPARVVQCQCGDTVHSAHQWRHRRDQFVPVAGAPK
jgi:hypothetical protein